MNTKMMIFSLILAGIITIGAIFRSEWSLIIGFLALVCITSITYKRELETVKK